MLSRSRLNAGLGAVLVVLMSVCVCSLLSIGRLERNDVAHAKVEDTRTVIDATLELVTDAESGERAYIITGDSTFLASYERALQSADSHLLALESLTLHDSGSNVEAHDLAVLLEQRLDQMSGEIDARGRHGLRAAALLIPRERRLTDSLRHVLHDLERQQVAELGPMRAMDTMQ